MVTNPHSARTTASEAVSTLSQVSKAVTSTHESSVAVEPASVDDSSRQASVRGVPRPALHHMASREIEHFVDRHKQSSTSSTRSALRNDSEVAVGLYSITEREHDISGETDLDDLDCIDTTAGNDQSSRVEVMVLAAPSPHTHQRTPRARHTSSLAIVESAYTGPGLRPAAPLPVSGRRRSSVTSVSVDDDPVAAEDAMPDPEMGTFV
jgi:hypothetical protein